MRRRRPLLSPLLPLRRESEAMRAGEEEVRQAEVGQGEEGEGEGEWRRSCDCRWGRGDGG